VKFAAAVQTNLLSQILLIFQEKFGG
jgi:hypothetical protein